MEFVFEQTPWELTLDALKAGDKLSALRCLSLMEGMSQEDAQEALLDLEEKGVALDVSDLPANTGDSEAALRLRLEQQFVKKGCILKELEENDPLRLYLEELAAIPAVGDVDLLAGQYLVGEDVTQQLVNLSLSRVVERACSMTGQGVLLMDLIQEGSLGLWQGILHYTDGDYVNHTDWWIDQYLAKAVFLQAFSGGIGQKMRQGMEDFRDADQRLLSDLGRNPTLEEIAEAIHVSVEEAFAIETMLIQAKMRQKVEQSREPKEATAEDNHAVESTAYFQARQRILEMLSNLSEQEAKLLTLRFGLEGAMPLNPQQAAERLGLTPDEVIKMEETALSKLRQQEN